MGITLHPRAYRDVEEQYEANIKELTRFFFTEDIELTPTVKYSNIIDLAAGMYYLDQYHKYSTVNGMDTDCGRLRKIVKNRLQSALSTWSNHDHPLLPKNIAAIIAKMDEEIILEKTRSESSLVSTGSKKLGRVNSEPVGLTTSRQWQNSQ